MKSAAADHKDLFPEIGHGSDEFTEKSGSMTFFTGRSSSDFSRVIKYGSFDPGLEVYIFVSPM